MGVGLDADTMTDYSPDGEAAMADLYRSTRRGVGGGDTRGRVRATRCRLPRRCLRRRPRPRSSRASVPACSTSSLGRRRAVRQLFDLLEHGSPEGWERVGVRLGKVPAAIDGYRQNLAAGLDAGHRSTVRLAEAVASQCATWAGNGDGGWFGEFVADAADPAMDALAARRGRRLRRAGDRGCDSRTRRRRRRWTASVPSATGCGPWPCSAPTSTPTRATSGAAASSPGWRPTRSIECDRIVPGAGFAAVRDLLLTDPDRAVHGVDACRAWLQDTRRRGDRGSGRARSSTSPMRSVAATSGSRRWARPRRRPTRPRARTWPCPGACGSRPSGASRSRCGTT